MPKDVRLTLALLVTDLEKSGPIQKGWDNFSKLGNNKYHCHLSYKWWK